MLRNMELLVFVFSHVGILDRLEYYKIRIDYHQTDSVKLHTLTLHDNSILR